MTITVHRMKELVGNGRFFGVKFIKRTDGSLRSMVARTGVKPPPSKTGTHREWDPEEKGLLQVWDVQKRGFRMIPAENVQELRCGGQRITP